jgi:hypothetical protein
MHGILAVLTMAPAKKAAYEAPAKKAAQKK